MADKTKAISKKPTSKVTSLSAPQRGSNGSRYFTIKWSVNKWDFDTKNPARFEGFDIYFDIRLYDRDKKKGYWVYVQNSTGNDSRRDWGLNLADFKCTNGKKYKRDSFYPLKNIGVVKIVAKVRGYNKKGKGPWVTSTYDFEQPRKPSIESIEQDNETGLINVKVKHNKGQDNKENWNTLVFTRVWDSSENDNKGDYVGVYTRSDYMGTGEETHTYTVADLYTRMRQSYKQWLRVDVDVTSRGLYGDSETALGHLFVSWPEQPKIGECTVDTSKDAPIGDADGGEGYLNSKVTVKVDTGYNPADDAPLARNHTKKNKHPVTGIKLQKLVNVDYEKEEDIPGDAEWEDCGAVDNGNCKALSSTVAELQPERGKRTWVRVKAWNQNEDIFFRYSQVREMHELYRAPRSATGTHVSILSAISGDDGKSAVVLLAWDNDEATGTEVSWSDAETAWHSTQEPDTYRVTYDDGSVPDPEHVDGQDTHASYAHSATLNIAGLTEGTLYYIKARRYYVDEEDNESFGAYTETETVVPATSPKSVTLSAPEYVRRGSTFAVSWTFDSEAEQKVWQLITGATKEETVTVDGTDMTVLRIKEDDTTTTDPVSGKTTTTTDPIIILASGTDAMGSCVLQWDSHIEGNDSLRSILNVATGEPIAALPLAVRVGTGGKLVTSDAKVVKAADQPVLSVSVDDVSIQPMAVVLSCNVKDASVAVVVSADYVAGDTSAGFSAQTHGDTVWSTVATPSWTYDQSTGLYTCTLTANTGLDLRDNGRYIVTAKATDTTTGLTSEEAECAFTVDYARKAPVPSEDIVVTPYDTTDSESGVRTRGCTIELVPPTPNIATFSMMPKSDLYDATTNPDGVWAYSPNSSFTQLEDGWWHFEYDNSEGSTKVNNVTFRPRPLDSIVEGEQYTLLLEWRNNESVAANNQSFAYVQQTANTQFWGDSSAWRIPYFNGSESGTNGGVRLPDTEHHDLDYYIELFRWNFRVQPGDKADFDFRMSLYAGEYDGDWVEPTAESDRYDLYRMTADGPQLCASDIPLDATVNDPFAPFGDGAELAYRVRCHTVDGCEQWVDYPYVLGGRDMRIDFDNEYVELPYNLKADDSYEKDFEARRHLDGSIDGYWNEGAKRTASLSTDVIKVREEEKVRAVRRLARYCGPTYVRLNDGTAYQADVQVRGLGREGTSAAIGVSINATEVGLTADCMADVNSLSDEGQPDEVQGGGE